ncbi:MAG: helix-turn-helix domain-containing protein [bacterium]
MAEEVLKDLIQTPRRSITIESIQETVASHFGISSDQLRARTRKKEIVVPRQLAMYLCKHFTDSSLKTIGLHFGGRDHSTVIHAYQTIQEKIQQNIDMKQDVNHILETLDLDPGRLDQIS